MKFEADAHIYQWDADADFYLELVITAPTDKERNALLGNMRDRERLKVTVEIDDSCVFDKEKEGLL